MSYNFLQQDIQRKAYVDFAPEKIQDLREMLNGNFKRPDYLPIDSSINYNSTKPPVKYVVVHQGLETGPLRGVNDYNIKSFMDEYNATKTIIPSKYPNSETYIYKLAN